MGTCAIVSFRLGLSDGVSIVAAAWERALHDLGWSTYRVAGEGRVDRRIEELAIGAAEPPRGSRLGGRLDDALADADVVLVENLLTIPLNLPASRALIPVLAGRPAVLHHHDPPWQRARFVDVTELPPDDPCWRHVTINRLTEGQFAERGLDATTIYNGFDPDPPPGDRDRTRQFLGLDPEQLLVTHPVRAIARKNVPAAVALAERLGATYWLPGDAEEGYDDTLRAVLAAARCPVLRQSLEGTDLTISDLYAATDLVAFPSLWEGFGNPPIEAALRRRPAAVGRYAVAEELRELGFRWFDPDDVDGIAAAVADRSKDGRTNRLLDLNQRLARRHFSIATMTDEVGRLFERAGWRP